MTTLQHNKNSLEYIYNLLSPSLSPLSFWVPGNQRGEPIRQHRLDDVNEGLEEDNWRLKTANFEGEFVTAELDERNAVRGLVRCDRCISPPVLKFYKWVHTNIVVNSLWIKT